VGNSIEEANSAPLLIVFWQNELNKTDRKQLKTPFRQNELIEKTRFLWFVENRRELPISLLFGNHGAAEVTKRFIAVPQL
jgi:hypothetical protein